MQALSTLFFTNIAFLAGPLALKIVNKNRKFGMFLDGLTYASILSFCLFHILPEIIEGQAYYLFLVFILGRFFPLCPDYISQRFQLKNKKHMNLGLWIIIAVGFAIHVVAEGAILAQQNSLMQFNVALSVMIHRFGVGVLIINFFMRQQGNQKLTFFILALLIIGTSVGFFYGPLLLSTSHGLGILAMETFVAGTLLHFISHSNIFLPKQHSHHDCGHHHHHEHNIHEHKTCDHHHHDHEHHHSPKKKSMFSLFKTETSFSSYGALLVIVLLVFQVLMFSEGEVKTMFLAISNTFFHLLIESAGPLLLAFLCAGLFKTFLNPAHLNWLERGNRLTQASKGVVFGTPLPICSCGVLPLYHSLIKKGVPLSAALAFLLATPEIGLDAIFLTMALMGENFTIIRLVSVLVLSGVVAVGFSYLYRWKKTVQQDKSEEQKAPIKERLQAGLKYGFVDLVDHTIPWILLGILIASFMEHFISYEMFGNLSSTQQVVLFSIIGIPLYVCASGATPLAAILLGKGISSGAVIAFLLAGPATNLSTFGILRKLHGRKFALSFGLGVLLVAILIGLGVNFFSPDVTPISHRASHGELSSLNYIASVILGGIILISFIRQGMRHFLQQLYSSEHSH